MKKQRKDDKYQEKNPEESGKSMINRSGNNKCRRSFERQTTVDEQEIT
jgi:hypothetical protein